MPEAAPGSVLSIAAARMLQAQLFGALCPCRRLNLEAKAAHPANVIDLAVLAPLLLSPMVALQSSHPASGAPCEATVEARLTQFPAFNSGRPFDFRNL